MASMAQPAPAPVAPATPEDILLLREIRDSLKKPATA
jgi:large-conductance mechanosensitive channel